jgi:hypothetical protein
MLPHVHVSLLYFINALSIVLYFGHYFTKVSILASILYDFIYSFAFLNTNNALSLF